MLPVPQFKIQLHIVNYYGEWFTESGNEMDKKPVLWDKELEDLQPLRLPKSTPDARDVQERVEITEIQNSSGYQGSLEDILIKTTLKVDAPEWYPPSRVSSNCLGSFSSLNIHDNKNLQEVNVEDGANKVNHQQQSHEANGDSSDIIRLKQIISTLTKDPGQFDNMLDLFMESLEPYFQDVIALSLIAQLLVEQAITTPNFRYTGARLCWYVEQMCPEFRAELYFKCKKQLDNPSTNKQDVLLFIAELYTQLPHLNIYGALLIDCYKHLLSKSGSDDIKCICQALKLTGHSLEQSNKSDLDVVFEQLIQSKGNVNGSVRELVNSVIKLRTSNWGYSNETSDNANHISDSLYCGETTYYRTDGDTFTNEEKEFLIAHLDSQLEDFSDASDPDDLCDPEPEMDAEIQAAFKEFVQLSKH
ncbi:hypothetical protein NQ315_013357 [Exocentrus adspersus]|uniref:MIF4G domain-containing protein n=1 Tax=Exocentrus adspersus TaxID=1586481 RepID=A0AAV8VS86_9CUCU|nr:hypothetical protein NQ315_013357 [Exocentrus adspersus]